jgi:hypothetical protein
MLIALVTLAAQAQDVPQLNGQLFRPSADARATLWTEDTHRSPDGYASARSYVQYARAPVRWTGADGERELLVSDLLALDVLGAYHYRGLRLGVHMPLYGVAAGAGSPTQPGMGDLALDLKGTLLDGAENAVGVALLGRLTLPTASVAAPLGAGATGWEIAGIVDRQWDAWTVAANVGTRGVPEATYEDLVWNDQVFARLGAGYAFTPDVGVSGDLGLQTNWASGRNPAGTAAELMGGGWTRVTPDLVLRGGVSAGLTRAPGAPAARALVGLAWEPDPSPDLDVDGIVDRDDWCPSEPEDFDGFEDSDGCHDPQVTVRVDLLDPDGEHIDRGTVVLEGPERHRIDLVEPFVTLHPGVYELRATSTGFDTLVREVSVPAEQGWHLEQAMVALTASLTVFAVDEVGEPVSAELVVGDATPIPLDGGPLQLPVGEHALVVRAEGFRAHASSVVLERGADRQLSVVLEPLEAEQPEDDELVRADP